MAQLYLRGLRVSIPELGKIHPSLVEDYVEERLLDHVRRLNGRLCESARLGRWQACGLLFDQAMMLAQTFAELALVNPRPHRLKARRSLYMPSVRSRNPRFTGTGGGRCRAEAADARAAPGSGLPEEPSRCLWRWSGGGEACVVDHRRPI